MSELINIAEIIPATRTEGPGLRFALWVQGCSIRCAGCCNPEMLPFRKNKETKVETIYREILEAQKKYGIEGISCLGGEPFDQAQPLSQLTELVQRTGLSVLIFTGYHLEELKNSDNIYHRKLLSQTDILIDGPYIKELTTTSRRWIGSTNQRIHFLSNKYNPLAPEWKKGNQIELHFDGKELWICGFPASAWKLLKQKIQTNR